MEKPPTSTQDATSQGLDAFTVYTVNVSHVPYEDVSILQEIARLTPEKRRFPCLEDAYSVWLWLGSPGAWKENAPVFEDVGLTPASLAFFEHLVSLGVEYVRLDQDGPLLEGDAFPPFHW